MVDVNSKTVHELFEARKYAKTPEEKVAIQEAIDRAARGKSSSGIARPVKRGGKVVGIEIDEDKEVYVQPRDGVTVEEKTGRRFIGKGQPTLGGIAEAVTATKHIAEPSQRAMVIRSVTHPEKKPEPFKYKTTYEDVYSGVEEPETIKEIEGYKEKGYTAYVTPEGYTFERIKTQEEIRQEYMKQASQEYAESDVFTQRTRGFFAGVTMFPILVVETIGRSMIGAAQAVSQRKPIGVGGYYGFVEGVNVAQENVLQREITAWKTLTVDKDIKKFIVEHVLLSPTMTDVVYPFAMGYVAKPALAAFTKTASAYTGTTLKSSSYLTKLMTGGTITSMIGGETALIASQEIAGKVPSGTTMERMGRLGMQIFFAGLGAQVYAETKPIYGYRMYGKEGTKVFEQQRFLTSYKGKPIIKVGHPKALAELPSGIGKVVSPTKYISGDIPYQSEQSFIRTYKALYKPVTTSKGLSTIVKSTPESALIRPIISVSGIKGMQKIIYDVASGKITTEKIPDKPMKPFDTKFVPPENIPKAIEEILYKTKPVDIIKKLETKPVQIKIEDVLKGSFIITPKEATSLEPVVKQKPSKPFGYDIEFKPPVKIVKSLEKIYTDVRKVSLDAWKKLDVKPIVKTKQQLLIKKKIDIGGKVDITIFQGLKKLDTKFKAPVKKIKPIKEIYETIKADSLKEFMQDIKPLVKTKQTTLASSYKFEWGKPIEILFTKQLPTKPFKFPKVKPDIKPTNMEYEKATSVLLEKPSTAPLGKPTVTTKGDRGYDAFLKKTIPLAVEPMDNIISGYWKGVSPIFMMGGKPTSEYKKDSIKELMKIQKPSKVEMLKLDFKQGLKFETELQHITDRSFKQDLKSISLLENIVLQGTEQQQWQLQKQGQVQEQVQEQIQKQIQKIIYEKATTTEPPPDVLPPVAVPDAVLKKAMAIFGLQAYDVYTKKRQYVKGKRIRGTEWVKINKKPLGEYDAKGLGAKIVDNTAKATFKIVPTEGKPKKLRQKVSWGKVMMEYYQGKTKGTWVELNTYRIDSPGEIDEISRRGWEARKKGGSVDRVEKQIQNRVNTLMKKALGV